MKQIFDWAFYSYMFKKGEEQWVLKEKPQPLIIFPKKVRKEEVKEAEIISVQQEAPQESDLFENLSQAPVVKPDEMLPKESSDNESDDG